MTGSKGTILVVDDEAESLRLMIGFLEEEGYQVRPADSGELALAAVTAEAPELILLDIRMAGINGFEVCRRLKASEECREIPLMFISAATDVEERVEGLALGAVDFVSKPFQRGELLARVRTHLELGRLRTQLEKQVAHQTATLRATVEQLQLEVAERQRTEMVLCESEERFRATFFQAAVGIAQTSLQGEWLLLNNRFSEIVGYTQAELRGKTFVDITHPDDREANIVARRQFLAGEISSWSVEKRYIHKNGATVWARVHVSLVRDQHHVPQYFISVVEDITDKIQAERALQESERRLMLAQSAAHVGLWERDLRTNVKTISGDYAKLYGLPLDKRSLTYEEWLGLIHPDDGERLQTQIGESIERTGFWDTEFRVVWPDGSVHWLLTKGTVVLDDSGQPVRRAGVNLDITERKVVQDRLQASERRLSESEERLKSAQRLAHVGNWTWDIKADRVFWSEELCRIFGKPPNYTPDYAGFLQAVQPQDRERVEQSIRDSLAGKKSPDLLEFQITRPDSEVRTLACISEVLKDAAGSPVRISGACQDVTDQRRAEAALRRSLDEIAHLNRVSAMGELTSSLAHELNQPLAAILSNAQAAARFLNGASPDLTLVRECLIDIVVDDKRAGEVIRKLRTLLKKGEFRATLVDLNDVVHETIRLLGHDALLRKVSLKFEPLARLPLALADRVQLSQVVLNLIMNGLDAVAERSPGDRWVSVRTAEVDGGRVELTVEDSGKGIEESDLSRLFEPFFTTKQKGLGMGLSISRSIVQAHGGRIWAESVVGGGATFHCMLPVAQQGAASAK